MMDRRIVVLTQFLIGAASVAALPRNAAAAVTSFQAGTGGWQLGTLAVGNIDDDPQLELVIPYRDPTGVKTVWALDAFKPDGRRAPGFPCLVGERPINVTPTLYDLDGDGRMEILVTCGNDVMALRGDGSTLWSTRIDHHNYIPDGGYQVVTNGFYWSADNQWRDHLPDTSQFFSEVSPLMVADVDGNGSKKVVTAWKILPDSTSEEQDFNPFIEPLYGFGKWGTVGDVWSGGVVFFDALSGRKDFIYHIHQLVESGVGIGKPRPGAGPLVYVLNDSDSVVAFDKTKPYGLWGKGMLYKQFGKNQRLQSGSYLKGVEVYPADIDGDGEEELLVPTTQLDPLWQPAETILDDDGAVLWRKWKEPAAVSVNNGWLNNACMIPVNPDHDNHIDVLSFTHSYEIAFRSWNGIDLVDRPGWPKNFAPFVPTPPVVGDVDGDGQQEIIVGTYDPAAIPSSGQLIVFALDGAEEARLEVPGGLKHIPTLADADGDGILDVIYRSMSGEVTIRNFGGPAASEVAWGTHRANAQHDGNRARSLFPEGTPLVTAKRSGYRHTTFHWRPADGPSPRSWQIARAREAGGPFEEIARLPASATSFTDSGLEDGWLYFYEVRAEFPGRIVPSAPFAILSLLNGNLVANSGFEENDNSHWDKWFTGKIPWQNMVGCADQPYQGQRCMEIKLENQGDNSSIKQANQYGIPDPAIRTTAGKLYSFGGWFRSRGLSQRTEHWFEWNTTRTGDNINDIPPAPWPIYFTPHLILDSEAKDWTYANRVFVMPEGFPNAELRHRYITPAPVSGSVFIDNVFFRELPLLEDPQWVDLLPLRSSWSYQIDAPPADWTSETFDASAWPVAPAKFGGGTGARDVVTSLPWFKPAFYFRRDFDAPAGTLDELLLVAVATDDYNGRTYPLRVFLNGRETVSSGIDAVSGDGNSVHYFDLAPFKDWIRPGKNTIAVMVQNGYASDWDNIAFDLSLRAIPSRPAQPSIGVAQILGIEPNPNGTVTLRVSGPANTSWRVECAGSPASAAWKPVETITLSTAGQATVAERLDGVHLQSIGPRARFYRLVQE